MKKLIVILIQLFVFFICYPQDISITAEAPPVVAVGEQFRISWTANSRGGEFVAPDISDFNVLSGPQTSFSQSTKIINGKVTTTISNTYTYYVQATREGKFTIPPARYILEKDEYLSEPIEIEVVSDGARVSSPESSDSEGEAETKEGAGSSDIYVRLIVNKKNVYLGEHLVASLKIYSRVNLSGIQEVEYPDFKSFLKEDLETAPLRSLTRENVNGSIYETGILQRFLLYPQRTGTISIDPANLTVLLQQESRSKDPFFGDFFSSFTTVPKMIATLPVEITVKPLPPGAPPDFNGAVGDFSISSTISADTVSVNDALTYRIILKGTGNMKLTSAPELNLTPDIEIYEPEISSDLTTSVSGTSGSRIFEYVLIPRHHGTFTIPSVNYSYFDPSSGQYKILNTGEHKFVALRSGEEKEDTRVYGGVSKENIRFLGKDIRYIITGKPNFRAVKNILIINNVFLYSYLGLALVFLIVILLRREQIKRNSDIVRVRNRKAAGVASKRLKKAAECFKNSDTEGFYAELLKAILGYLGDKYNIPLSELSIDKVNRILQKNKLDKNLIDELEEVIGKCEYSRYSPDSDLSTADEVYGKAERIIKSIENK